MHDAHAGGGTEGHGSSQHEIERAVLRLNAWFAENKDRIPRCLNWRCLRRQRTIPVFKAVRTTAIKDWKVEDLTRLFRVLRMEESRADGDLEVPIELLVADKSLQGAFLNVREMMDAAFDVFAARHLLGKFSPRLRWFWSHASWLTAEMETYVPERAHVRGRMRHLPTRRFRRRQRGSRWMKSSSTSSPASAAP